jgi:hypothetical protein
MPDAISALERIKLAVTGCSAGEYNTPDEEAELILDQVRILQERSAELDELRKRMAESIEARTR